MKRVLLLALISVLGANCASRTLSQESSGVNLNQRTPQTMVKVSATPSDKINEAVKEAKKEKGIPVEFHGIDFKNFSYSTNWRPVQLKDGSYAYEDRKNYSHESFAFEDVDFVDLTGDGNKEALVQLSWVSCGGGSCDGSSHLFYVYSISKKKLTLLWRIETGSLGYRCGLKSLVVSGRKFTFEVFRKCHLAGTSFDTENSVDMEKLYAKGFTRFIFEFNGRKFTLRKREVVQIPEKDLRGYDPVIIIGNGE